MNRTVNRILALSCVLLAGLVAMPDSLAQARMTTHDGENDVVLLDELGLVVGVMPGSEELSVLTVLPDAEPGVEVKDGDLLLMINGKRVRDAVALREAYESAEVGETVKIGFRRGDERFLASFERKSAEGGPKRMVMMMAGPESGSGDLQPAQEFGAVLGEKDGEVVVAMQMPTDDALLEEGDVVKSINGETLASVAAFREAYEPLEIGAEIVLVVSRGEDDVTMTRSKSAAAGVMKIRRGP
jgi:S1-C subfamily serine protease